MNTIRSYRKQQKLSQMAFAKLIHVRQTAISNYENGRRLPSFKIAVRIQKATNGALSIRDLRPDIYPIEAEGTNEAA
ncbi:MAG: helix-turn-helix transcriptional regulator [Gammaproteobacteria bacterium]|nr:helix-turn-helix transcriptional regulator [Gammaproteobacteria bacterium]